MKSTTASSPVVSARATSAVLLVIGAETFPDREVAVAIRSIAPASSWKLDGDADSKTRLDMMRARQIHRALAFGPLWSGSKLTPVGEHVRALLAGLFPVRWISRPKGRAVDLTTMPASSGEAVKA